VGSFTVLDSEPRHKVEDFVKEMLGRRKAVIEDMRPALQELIVGLLTTIEGMKERDPLIDLGRVRVEETKWTKDGRLVLWLSTLGLLDSIVSDRYYIDDLVAELVDKNDHVKETSGEVAQFISAMIDQFAFIKKHDIETDLTKITFENMKWVDQRLVFDIKYNGEPFSPKEARW
jgi:hypothetical protein